MRRRIPALLGASLFGLAANAHAAWPEKPIKLVVPYAAAGAADALARVVAAELGALPATGGAKELGDFVRAGTAKRATVITTARITFD